MTNDYDAQIDAAFPTDPALAATAKPEVVPKTATVQEPAAKETDNHDDVDDNGDPKPKSDANDDVTFPKKAINAISRRDKQIGKLRAEYQAMQQKVAQYEAAQTAKPATANQSAVDDGPREMDFNTYGDYLKAVARHEARKEWDSENQKVVESQRSAETNQYLEQRYTNVRTQADEFLAATPDARDLIVEYGDLIDDLPPQIEQLFLEADNAPLAMYNLIKEGKMETFGSLSVAKAAFEIGRAQMSAPPIQTRQVSNAPTPIAAAKGTGSNTGKSLDRMSYAELKEWQNS